MVDYQRVVDEIRVFLGSSDRTAQLDSATLAAEYAEACAEVNERLRRCAQFLQQGLRSEAIHLAESEPNLLDMAAVLDEVRAEWEQVSLSHGSSPPPALLEDAAAALNEAYALDDPLRDLLRNHRLLALSRAPLPLRIQVLRKIAKIDAQNAMWLEDLRSYERVRIQQFKEEVKVAAAERNVEALARLVAEVETTAWTGPLPEELVRSAKQASQRCAREHARSRLGEVENELHAASLMRDVAAGRQQRDLWEKLAKDAGLAPDDPLWGRVRPVLDWIDEQDRRDAVEREYQEAVSDLEAGLDDESPREELEALAQAVLKNDHEMPKALKTRYRKRLEGLQAGATRRRRLIVQGAAAAALVLVLGIGWMVRGGLREGRAAQVVKRVEELVKNQSGEGLEQARNLLDALAANDPPVAVHPAVAEVRVKLAQKASDEDKRRKKFQKALSDAEEAPWEQTEPDGLKLARDLARGSDEQEQVAEVVESRQEAAESKRAERVASFRSRIEALEPKVRELEVVAERSGGGEEVDQALNKVQKELAFLTQEGESLPKSSLGVRLASLAQKTNLVAKDRLSGRRRQELEEKITHAIAPPLGGGARPDQLFAAALDAYRREFPQEARARAFAKVQAELPLWKAVLDWDEIARGWPFPRTRLAPQEARTRAAACRGYIEGHPLAPNIAAIAEYEKFLAAFARRDPNDPANPKSTLLAVFSSEFMTGIWYAEDKDGHTYYMKNPPGIEGTIRFFYIKDFTQTELKIMNAGQITKSGPAPQVGLAQALKPRIKNVELNSWDSTMTSIAEAIKKESNVDPLYRLTLAGLVIRNAGEASYCLQIASAKQMAAIEKAKGGKGANVAWMNADDPSLRRKQDEARAGLEHLPPFSTLAVEAEKQCERIEQQLGTGPRWVGWLVRGEDGHWQCLTVSKSLSAGKLVVLVADPQTGKTGSVWLPVGDVKDGAPRLDSSTALAEGRPVFLMLMTAEGRQR